MQVKLECGRSRIALLLTGPEYLCRVHISPIVELVNGALLCGDTNMKTRTGKGKNMAIFTASLTSIIRNRLKSLQLTRDARAALDPNGSSTGLLDNLYVGLFKSMAETITSPTHGLLWNGRSWLRPSQSVRVCDHPSCRSSYTSSSMEPP